MHMRLFRGTHHSQHGDTIVEVLICLAVISLILAAAYAMTSHNVRAIQDTNERSQALQLAQQQVERLRIFVPTSIAMGTSTTLTNQCLDDGASASNPSSPQVPDDCDISPSGGSAQDCASPFCYKISVSNVVVAGVPTNSYQVIVTWPSLLGNQSSVTEFYRPS